MNEIIMPGTIVYSYENGFGIVCKPDADTKGNSVAFYNGKRISLFNNISTDTIKPVAKTLTEYVKTKQYLYDYSDITQSRGYQYFNTGNVESLGYNHRQISLDAVVYGSRGHIYDLSVNVVKTRQNKFKLMSSCSCPVGTLCKHSFAAILTYKSTEEYLENYYMVQQKNKTLKTNSEFTEQVKKFRKFERIDIRDGKELVRVLKDNGGNNNLANISANFLEQVYESYNHIYSYQSHTMAEVIRYMLYDKDIFNKNEDIKNEIHASALKNIFAREFNKVQDQKYKNFQLSDCSLPVQIQFYYDNKYDELINAYIKQNKEYQLHDNINLIGLIPGDFCVSKEIQDKILDCVKDKNTADIAYTLSHFLTEDQKIEIFFSENYSGSLPISVLKKIGPEGFISRYCGQLLSNELFNSILSDIDKYINIDHIKTALILDREFFKYHTRDEHNKIIKAAKKLPHSKYLNMYYSNNPSSYYYGHGEFFSNSAPIELPDEEELLTYFHVSYYIEAEEESYNYDICYRLLSPDNSIVACCRKNQDNQIIKEANYLDFSKKSPVFPFIVKYVDDKYKSEIDSTLSKHAEIVSEKEKEKQYEDFRKKVLSLSEQKKRMILGKKDKVSLELHFDTSNSHSYSLELKVGNNKKYVVSDLYQFLYKFENNEISTFGKQLNITHNINNFDESSKENLSILLSIYNSSEYASKKTLNISKLLCKTMLKNSLGHIVYINDTPLYMSEEQVHIEAKVDQDYILTLTDDNGKAVNDVIDLYDSLLLTSNNGKAYFADLSSEETEIIRFLSQYIGMNIEKVSDLFASYVMPYYGSKITLADKLKERFPISNIKIKAYFDYNDKEISLKEEIFRNDKHIEKTEIQTNEDIIHYERYHDLTLEMGFEDGVLQNEQNVLNFFRMDFSDLKQYCDVMLSESILNKKISSFGKQTVKIRHQGNIMQAFLKESDYSNEELEQIYKAIKRKKSYVILSDNRIIALDNENAKDFKKTVDELSLDPKILHEEKKLTLAQALKTLSYSNCCETDEYLERMISDIRNFKNYKMSVPKINGEFRQYQTEGIKWLKVLSEYGVSGILADDMGLGKTLEIIGLISSDNKKKPSLILCPKSLIFNWKNEFAKFSPGENVIEIYGNQQERKDIISSIKAKEKTIYISSYDSLRNDIETYSKTEFNYIIADEAQNIKNTETQKSKNSKQLKAIHKFALTGTPIENSISDLWSIFDFTMPGYFDDLPSFMADYEDDEKAHEILAKQIAPFVLRRTKELVLEDLPDKYERVVTAEMSEEQRKIYDAYVQKARDMLDSGLKAFDMLPYITRLRQICVDPNMFVDEYKGKSGKMERLLEIIDEYTANGKRMLIFSQFVKGLECVEKLLDERNLPYYLLTGDTAAEKRIELADQFNSGIGPGIFLISLKAGGTGLNLIGADTVIHLDPWWNISAENQATDRAHRIGQTKNVEVIKLICENSIEQRVVELQNLKKDIIDKVISNDDSSVTSASLKDIAFILDR